MDKLAAQLALQGAIAPGVSLVSGLMTHRAILRHVRFLVVPAGAVQASSLAVPVVVPFDRNGGLKVRRRRESYALVARTSQDCCEEVSRWFPQGAA